MSSLLLSLTASFSSFSSVYLQFHHLLLPCQDITHTQLRVASLFCLLHGCTLQYRFKHSLRKTQWGLITVAVMAAVLFLFPNTTQTHTHTLSLQTRPSLIFRCCALSVCKCLCVFFLNPEPICCLLWRGVLCSQLYLIVLQPERERVREWERERTELNLERERMSQFWCWQWWSPVIYSPLPCIMNTPRVPMGTGTLSRPPGCQRRW